MTSKVEIQLGKKGLSTEFLEELKKRFEKPSVKNIKIHVLQNARENREDVKKYADEILNFLGKKFDYKIVGFSIFVLKLRKERKE
jgi:RNA-binding protein YhbY